MVAQRAGKYVRFYHLAQASLGSGLDGWKGFCHGAVLMLIFDEIIHELASRGLGFDNVTATLTSNFKRPVKTPVVVLCRASMGKDPVGRKLWIKSTIEDRKGVKFASAEGFLVPMKEKL